MILNQHSAFTLGVGHGVLAMATLGLWPDVQAAVGGVVIIRLRSNITQTVNLASTI
ncbi:MAG: hypothetical protein AB1513_11380 [Pseudomonadota bacterium]